jgi:hypothetical protein
MPRGSGPLRPGDIVSISKVASGAVTANAPLSDLVETEPAALRPGGGFGRIGQGEER